MIGQEYSLETYPPEWLFPGTTGVVVSSSVPLSLSDALREREAEPINVGALQAAQVETAVKTVVSSVTNFASGVGSWIQSTGQTVVLIAVLGFGAWALSSLASLRRQ